MQYIYGLYDRLRLPAFFALVLVCLAVYASLAYLRAGAHMQTLNLAVYDIFLRLMPGAEVQDPRIVVLAVSDSDINRLEEWPLSDQTLAEILETLAKSGPRVIGVDIYRDRPVPPGREALQEILLQQTGIIMINKFITDGIPAVSGPDYMEAAGRVGFSDIPLDPGGEVRRGLLYLDDGKSFASSFALMLALQYLRHENVSPQPGNPDPSAIRLGNITLPPLETDDGPYSNIDASGYQLLLDYAGGELPFPVLPLAGLLSGQLPAETFRDKIVIVGVAAETVKDSFLTPFSGGLQHNIGIPGAVIHAHLAGQLLRAALDSERPLSTPGKPVQYGWILFWCIAGTLSSTATRSVVRFMLLVTGGLALLFLACYTVFVSGWWLTAVSPALGWIATAALGTAYLSGRDRAQHRLLMQLFSSHVSDQVARELWHNRKEFIRGNRLSSRELPATVMFTDIECFTTISEALAPDELMEWLNGYMESMSNIIMEHGGVIDDYYGDGIKANFGVPIGHLDNEAISRDAINALQCALHMNRELASINAMCRQRELPLFRMRVGICTGNVVAGCLGSAKRMKYTTVGDTVNIAARLESFGKADTSDCVADEECRILIAESTWRLVHDIVGTVSAGQLPLKGKRETVGVYRVAMRPGSNSS